MLVGFEQNANKFLDLLLALLAPLNHYMSNLQLCSAIAINMAQFFFLR